MIPFDDSAIFPPPSMIYDLGGSLGAGMDTTITTKDSGFSTTFAHYSSGRRRYENIKFTVRNQSDLMLLKNFYWARSGSAMGFNFWDCNDHSSALSGADVPNMLDEPLVQDENGNWRLVKRYGGSIIRYIFKPIVTAIPNNNGNQNSYLIAPVLADGGVLVTGGYTIDPTTGIVSGYTPTGLFTAGFYFYTPARFDGPMKFSADDYQIGSVLDLTLRELIYPI